MTFLSIKTKLFIKGKPVFTVIVGKSIAKKAVERNRLKRRIRAIVRPLVKAGGRNYVIIAQREAAKASFTELKEELERKIINIRN